MGSVVPAKDTHDDALDLAVADADGLEGGVGRLESDVVRLAEEGLEGGLAVGEEAWTA